MMEIPDRAWKLLSAKDSWTQGDDARTEDGLGCCVDNPNAVQFCAAGAIERVYGDYSEEYRRVKEALWKRSKAGIEWWNDDPRQTREEVVALLRELDI